MSEFNGEPLQTEKVYDEDEEVEVKYEPFDSELIRELEILGYDSGCLTCQKVIKKITAHLTDHIGSSSNDVDGLTEPTEYIVDPNYIIKIEPEDNCLKSDPRDVGIMNDTQRPGSHDSSNSGQRQWKVLDFDTGQCSPDCEICKKYLLELREHLAINHPQLQFQPSCAPAPLPGQSTVHGPLKTLTLKNTRPHLRQIGKTVDGKYILEVVLTPDMEKQNRLEDMRRKTRTSMRAGYVEESITTHPSSSNPVKKKSRPDSDPNDQNKNEESKPTNRVPYDDNSDTERKSKESESKGRSSNEIQTENESSKLSSTSAVSHGENAESSDNLTDHLSHAGLESQDITQIGDDLTEMSKTTVEGESLKMIHGGRRESKKHHSGEKVDVPTDTGEKQAVIFLTGGRNRKMSRIADKMSHTEEKPTNFDQIMSEPAKTFDTAGELPNLTHNGVIPSMTTRPVDKPARPTVTQSEGKRKPTKMLKPEFLKRLKSSESESTSSTPLDNSYNRKKCGKIFSANNNLWHRNYVVYGDKRFECSECGQSFMTKNALTLHEKIHLLRNNLLVKNCQNKVRGQLSHTGGNSTFCVSGEPLTKTLRIGKPTNSIRIDHEGGKETQISNSGGESNAPGHIGTDPGPVTTIGTKSENADRITVASGKSTNMATGEGKLVSMILAAGELAKITHVGEELENTTSTVEKSPKLTVTGRRPGVIVDAGGESTNMNRVEGRSWNMSRTAGKLDEMGHTEEKPEELACIMGDPVRPAGLTTHVVIEIASEEELFKCEICEKNFDRAAGLALHKLDHTDFPCDECGINFSSSDRLSDHKRHHALGTLHTCDECGKGFELLKWLTAHYEIHMRNFPFQCDECNCSVRFKTQSDLMTHMVTRHGQKLFGCDVCGMRFQTPPDLMTHMVIHLGQKTFRCDICEERFKGREEWNSHMVIHSREEQKRHRCGSCGKAFNRPAQLTDHSVIHSVRPFKCYICGKCFEILPELTNHIVIHSEWKPYNCYICQERSKIPRNVKDPAKKTASEESVKNKGSNEGRNRKKTNNENETEKPGPSKIPVKVPKPSRKRKDETYSPETDSDDDLLLISRIITPERVFQIPNKFSMEKFKAAEENQARIRGLPVAQFLPDYDTFKAINRRLSKLYKLDGNPYRCALCSHLGLSIYSRDGDAFHAFKQAQDFEQHYETHHHTRPTCPICQEPFDTSKHVQGHIRHMVARGHEAHIRGQVDLKARATTRKKVTAQAATAVNEANKVRTAKKKKYVISSDSSDGQNESGSKEKAEKNPKKKSRKK